MIGIGASASVCAQVVEPQDDRSVYFALFGGVTGGGDKLVTVRFTDGPEESVRAGALFHGGVGVLAYPSNSFSVQSTIGYHADSAGGCNVDVRFTRYPIELLGHYTGWQGVRLGGGLRYVLSPTVRIEAPGTNIDYKFKNTFGYVLEAGLGVRRAWINVRYTIEKYKLDSINGTSVNSSDTAQGNSIGLNVVFGI